MKTYLIGCFIALTALSGFSQTALYSEENKQPTSMLDFIPAEAAGSISIQNLKDVETRGQAMLKELNAPNNWQISQFFRMGMGYLGIKQGIDDSGTFVLALMPWEGDDFNEIFFEGLVLRVPFTDADEIAANFALPEGSLVPEKIHKIDNRLNNSKGMYVSAKDGALLMSMSESAIRKFQKSKSIGDQLEIDSDRQLATSDILLHLNAHFLLRHTKQSKRGIERMLENLPEFEREEVRQASREMVHAAELVLWSCKIDRGVNVSFRLTFDDTLSDQTRKLLATWGSRTQAPDLRGFPSGNLAFAISKTADGLEHPEEVRQVLRWLLMDLHQGNIRHLKEIAGPFLTPTPNTFQEVFDEIWNSLDESQAAGYFNQNIEEQGLMSLLAILRPEDPKQFYDDLAGLVKFSRGTSYNPSTMREEKIEPEEIQGLIDQLGDDDFRVRKAVTLRLKLLGEPALAQLEKSKNSTVREVASRSKSIIEHITQNIEDKQEHLIRKGLSPIPLPTFVLYENQRQIEGHRVDVLQARWDEDTPELRSQLREILGPHGSEILLVHVEGRIVVFLGSDRALLESCIKLLDTKQAGVEQAGVEQQVELFRKYRSPNQLVEFHVSQQRLRSLMPEHLKKRLPDSTSISPDVTSIGAEVAPTHLRLDVTIPISEMRLTMRSLGMF